MKDDDEVFHFKLCYPEMTEEEFPCLEWKQSSNPLKEPKVTGFVGIRLNWPLRSDNKPFGGLMKSNPGQNLMDDFEGNWWWNSIGTIQSFQGKIPGPVRKDRKHIGVKKKVLYCYTIPTTPATPTTTPSLPTPPQGKSIYYQSYSGLKLWE